MLSISVWVLPRAPQQHVHATTTKLSQHFPVGEPPAGPRAWEHDSPSRHHHLRGVQHAAPSSGSCAACGQQGLPTALRPGPVAATASAATPDPSETGAGCLRSRAHPEPDEWWSCDSRSCTFAASCHGDFSGHHQPWGNFPDPAVGAAAAKGRLPRRLLH